jgi:hypothetical protein
VYDCFDSVVHLVQSSGFDLVCTRLRLQGVVVQEDVGLEEGNNEVAGVQHHF